MTTETMSCEQMYGYLNGSCDISVRDLRALAREHLTEKVEQREQELRGRRFGIINPEKKTNEMTVEEVDDYEITL